MKTNLLGRYRLVIALVLALIVGLAGGAAAMYWLRPAPFAEGEAANAPGERKILYYRNPMGTGHTSPKPMKDDMGMDYLPVYADEVAGTAQAAPGTVSIDPTVIQNIGVRTAPVARGTVATEIEANGVLAPDETRTTTVTTKIDGYIERLYVNAVGQAVRKGDPLFDLYSPDLSALLEEFLAAVRYREAVPADASDDTRRSAGELAAAAQRRLELLGLDRAQIARIAAQRTAPRAVTFYAERAGVVLKKNVLAGGYVAAASELFTLADLTQIWVIADVYAQDLSAVRVGQSARVSVQGLPGRRFAGRVDFIYPTMDAQTRTVKLRVVLANPQRLLRPDMYARVTVAAGGRTQTVLVPKSAVLRSGKQDIVLLALGEGRFRPQAVRLGGESGEHYVVADGVKAGEVVVTSAQFLLDSESKINEAVQKMGVDGAGAAMPAVQPQDPPPAPVPAPAQGARP